MKFLEKHKVNCDLFSTGNTAVRYTPYYDMLGVKRLDAFIEGRLLITSVGAAGGSALHTINAALYQASNSTGGGSTAISSATCVMGKTGTAAVSTAGKMRTGFLGFSTISGSNALTIYVGTAAYLSASVGSAGAANRWVAGASAAATVAANQFAAMFNSTVYNTSTVIVNNFYADTAMASAAVPEIWIRPKDPDSTVELSLTCPSTLVYCGGQFFGHIGIEPKHLKDGCRYVAVGAKSTDIGPYTVTVVRELETPRTATVVNFKAQDLTDSTAWTSA